MTMFNKHCVPYTSKTWKPQAAELTLLNTICEAVS